MRLRPGPELVQPVLVEHRPCSRRLLIPLLWGGKGIPMDEKTKQMIRRFERRRATAGKHFRRLDKKWQRRRERAEQRWLYELWRDEIASAERRWGQN